MGSLASVDMHGLALRHGRVLNLCCEVLGCFRPRFFGSNRVLASADSRTVSIALSTSVRKLVWRDRLEYGTGKSQARLFLISRFQALVSTCSGDVGTLRLKRPLSSL